jgi:multiple sugar transport system permease protein
VASVVGVGGATVRMQRRPLRARFLKALPGFLLVSPTLGLLLGLISFPVLYNVYLGFFRVNALTPAQQSWRGLDNYERIVTDDQFWHSFQLGWTYTITTTVGQLILGVAAALLLNETFRGRGLARGIVLFPYMVPTIVSVVLWKWIMNDQYGLLNYMLLSVGLIPERVVWLSPSNMMLGAVLVSIWAFFPFVVLSVLARLQTISPELYDAAKVDGANVVDRFRHITLPQIATVLFIATLLRGIFMFTKFDVVWLWAGDFGGLGEYVRTLPVYAYQATFGMYQAGLGAAIANIMVLMLIFTAFIYFRVFRQGDTTA